MTGIPTTADDIKITTIKTIMFNSQRNDISFLANNRFMVLSEHQSSINENMPLQMLLYVAMLYYRQVRRKTLYQEKRILLEKIITCNNLSQQENEKLAKKNHKH